jgi:hypothetical protein
MLSRAVRKSLMPGFLKNWIARWLVHLYTRKAKLSDSADIKNQQIADLQRELAALKSAQVGSLPVSLADQFASLQKYGTAIPPVQTPAAVLQQEVPASVVSAQSLQQEPETAMTLTPPEAVETPTAAAPETAPAPALPPAQGSSLPDVKMLAPLLKIALATLSIEQMVEIGLHVKMGSPGFQQFLESDTAKTIFRDGYAKYCDFLAGKVK